MKKTKDWPAYVQQLQADRKESRKSVNSRVLDLNEQIDTIKRKREEITKAALEGFVVGTMSQANYQEKIQDADKLWGKLNPLIEARDEVIKTGKGIIEEEESKMVPELVSSINDVQAEVRAALIDFTENLKELYAKAEHLGRLQSCRVELNNFVRSIDHRTDLRTLGLKIDQKLNQVLDTSAGIGKFSNLLSWTVREMEKTNQGGLFGLMIPEYLNVKQVSRAKPKSTKNPLDGHAPNHHINP